MEKIKAADKVAEHLNTNCRSLVLATCILQTSFSMLVQAGSPFVQKYEATKKINFWKKPFFPLCFFVLLLFFFGLNFAQQEFYVYAIG